jgi:hypothetical protein
MQVVEVGGKSMIVVGTVLAIFCLIWTWFLDGGHRP